MHLDTQKIIKALFIACLIVVLTTIKSKLEPHFEHLDLFLYFFLFLTSLFIMSIIEVVFEKLDESDWFKKIINKRDYIQGAWLNYAMDADTREIYNFALLKIDRVKDQIRLDGSTFRALITTDGNIITSPDGHFFSSIAQYQSENGQLGFDFTVDFSERVRECKHQIIGNATYFFERSDKVPRTFTGEFSTEHPATFCNIIGHRVDEKLIAHSGSLLERYRRAIEIAIQRNWIESNQLPKAQLTT
ncbi:MAG: hypothetical protein DMF72_03260 [Acidobacteria bacterium]|nr:MAG: hypothetical protein DMF72_03260 [Acidobacteriota bacterium]